MNNLSGKKVLLLSPLFYKYEEEIEKKLVEMGASVTYIDDDPSESFRTIKGLLERFKLKTRWMIRHFEECITTKLNNKRFDYIIVVCGWAITSKMTHRLRDTYLTPEGKMVLYYWDSLKRLQDDRARWRDFDSIYTFDIDDYKSNNSSLKYLPLFYCDKYWTTDHGASISDASIVGSFRLDRLDLVRKLKKCNPDIVVDSYLYHSRFVLLLHRLLRKEYRDIKAGEVNYQKMSFEEVVKRYLSSKAVVDIPAVGQSGLTIRTFETLAMHKKLITTNPNVKSCDFYNDNDIFVLSLEDYRLPGHEWFETKFSIPDSMIKQYSLEEWLNKLVG